MGYYINFMLKYLICSQEVVGSALTGDTEAETFDRNLCQNVTSKDVKNDVKFATQESFYTP